MYNIEKTGYGIKLTFSGYVFADEMEKWVRESLIILNSLPQKFGVLVDMRKLKPIDPDSQIHMKDGQKLFKGAGMQKSVVILDNVYLTLQFKRIAKETGIFECERYIDSSKIDNWEEAGINWLVNNIDPDEKDSVK